MVRKIDDMITYVELLMLRHLSPTTIRHCQYV